MAWEHRGTQSYYYRKKRDGGRVRSVYIGNGLAAQRYAENASAKRRERAAVRSSEQMARHADSVIDRELRDAEVALGAVVNAAFRDAGFHKHKGQWRKKRHE